MKRYLLAAVLVLFLGFQVSPSAVGQDARELIYVSTSATDPAGIRVVYHVKENVRRSAIMRLVVAEEDSAYQIRILTLDPDNRGERTFYSFVLTKTLIVEPKAALAITHYIGICPLEQAATCADTVVAVVDQKVSAIQEEGTRQKKLRDKR